ncbi:MAG: FAD-binding protein, partial [Chloroflexota bacterium]
MGCGYKRGEYMRRWNGWGDDTVLYHLPASAGQFLYDRIGAGTPPVEASLKEVVSRAPASRLPDHPLVSLNEQDRTLHARGQSLPDWLALRYGSVDSFPDGVAFPLVAEDVRELLRYARQAGAKVIPYGGGTSVVGHINPLLGDDPVLTVDLSRMNRLVRLDETGLLATFE